MRIQASRCLSSALLALSIGTQLMLAQSGRTVVRPTDTGAALINPGMGWMFHHYDNNITRYTVDLEPSDGVDEFPGVSSVYLRLAWSYLEPEEGKFNWALIDTPIQKWISKGKKIAFRITTSEGSASQGYATPRWVQEAGAKGVYLQQRKIVEKSGIWEPDFNDSVFLEKLDRFLAAFAARYDGNPHVAFIDVGSFGVWGEGHTVASSGLPYSVATIKRHIDLYRKHFKRTLLIANDDFALQGRGLETLGYARDMGLGLRDDSILVDKENPYFHAYLAADFWPRVPVVLECEHYGSSKKRGAWGDGSKFLQAIEEYHASYATVHWYPREFLKDNADLVKRINMRLGYRLQLVEASWPSEVEAGGTFTVGYSWRNAGVAPCLPGGHPTLTFKDAKGGIAGVFVDDDFNVRELPVGPPAKAKMISRTHWTEGFPQEDKPLLSYKLPPKHILKPGVYDVYISVGDQTGSPSIALPLPDDDGHRRYRLGKIKIL